MAQDQAKMKETDANQDDNPDVDTNKPTTPGLPSAETFTKAIALANEWLKEACRDQVQVYGVAAHLHTHGRPDNLVHVPVQIRFGPVVHSFIIEWHAEKWDVQPGDHDKLASVIWGGAWSSWQYMRSP
ncbi:hypothetical protein GE09DRAFT_1064591 [Coniochaeta sp. 2T2.1]|nr:hypothetical protein GE09DRAFT_1064591 [Coniochaeta sp. 2T2.1]